MRIAGWHVEGFGMLHDLEVKDLPEGLTVVHGPNEAGKSTLLDFLRGVLFGFPDRRSRLAFREPLMGGRHGGRVTLVDHSGARYELERIVGTRGPSLFGSDGVALEPVDLARLLGGADGALFSSVFAFGLDELASLASLERGDVRDRLFSAGVLGAGRSATRAGRALGQRQDALVRPRQGDAAANALRHRIEAAERDVRAARERAAGFHGARAECDRLAAELAAAAATRATRARRQSEVARLLTAWPALRRGDEANEELRALGPLPAWAARLLGERDEVRRLAGERTGHLERCRTLAGHQRQLAGIESGIEETAARIGLTPGTRRDDVVPPAPALAETERARELVGRLGAAELDVANRAAEREAAAEELERGLAARAAAERQARDWLRTTRPEDAASEPVGIYPLSDLQGRGRALEELRGHVAERERLGAIVESQHREDDLRSSAAAAAAGAAPGLAVALLLGVTVLLAIAAAVAIVQHHGVLAALAGSAGVVVLVTAVLLGARARPRAGRGKHSMSAPAPASGPDSRSSSGEPSAAERLDAERVACASLAARLGLDEGIGAPGLATAALALGEELAHRRRLDELDDALDRARLQLDAAEARLAERRRVLGALAVEIADEASARGLPATSSPTVYAAALDGLKELAELHAARARLRPTIAALGHAVDTYERGLAGLLERLGEPVRAPDASGAPDEVAERRTSFAEVAAALARRLEAADEESSKRRELERVVAASAEDLDANFGAGEGSTRLRAELEAGDLLDWEAERRALELEVASDEERYEELVRAHTTAARELDTLLASDEIASLELELAGLRGELETVLREWAVLGLARALLERTLAHYERERQPRVLALAGQLFGDVTHGAYTGLVAYADADGARSHGIAALAADGRRVDSGALSRGTAEQLYLCLRLAFAANFAQQSAALPFVLDDVLVNFDPGRAGEVARAIATTAKDHQILAFTCHPHLVELLLAASPGARLIELPRSAR